MVLTNLNRSLLLLRSFTNSLEPSTKGTHWSKLYLSLVSFMQNVYFLSGFCMSILLNTNFTPSPPTT
uniref:Uncharacterized protein n=1 Tax=Arundo donax TaxID=35708 RepID=A0A0A8XZ46_ARUDO